MWCVKVQATSRNKTDDISSKSHGVLQNFPVVAHVVSTNVEPVTNHCKESRVCCSFVGQRLYVSTWSLLFWTFGLLEQGCSKCGPGTNGEDFLWPSTNPHWSLLNQLYIAWKILFQGFWHNLQEKRSLHSGVNGTVCLFYHTLPLRKEGQWRWR